MWDGASLVVAMRNAVIVRKYWHNKSDLSICPIPRPTKGHPPNALLQNSFISYAWRVGGLYARPFFMALPQLRTPRHRSCHLES